MGGAGSGGVTRYGLPALGKSCGKKEGRGIERRKNAEISEATKKRRSCQRSPHTNPPPLLPLAIPSPPLPATSHEHHRELCPELNPSFLVELASLLISTFSFFLLFISSCRQRTHLTDSMLKLSRPQPQAQRDLSASEKLLASSTHVSESNPSDINLDSLIYFSFFFLQISL